MVVRSGDQDAKENEAMKKKTLQAACERVGGMFDSTLVYHGVLDFVKNDNGMYELRDADTGKAPKSSLSDDDIDAVVCYGGDLNSIEIHFHPQTKRAEVMRVFTGRFGLGQTVSKVSEPEHAQAIVLAPMRAGSWDAIS